MGRSFSFGYLVERVRICTSQDRIPERSISCFRFLLLGGRYPILRPSVYLFRHHSNRLSHRFHQLCNILFHVNKYASIFSRKWLFEIESCK